MGWGDGDSSEGDFGLMNQTNVERKKYKKSQKDTRRENASQLLLKSFSFLYPLNPDTVGGKYFKDSKDFYLHDRL